MDRPLSRFRMACLACICVLAAGCSRGPSGPQTIAIAYTNDMEGEIRSCGCGKNDLGGLGRRGTFFDNQRRGGQELLLLEGGDMFGADVNYGREKAELTLRSYSIQDYLGIAVGENDLIYGADFLKERSEALKLPILAANLIDSTTNKLVFPPFRNVELSSGLRVGIVGVIEGVDLPEQAGGLKMSSARAAVERLVPKLRGEHKADIVVVLAHMPLLNLRLLAKGLQGVDVIVIGHDALPSRKIRRMGGAFVLSTSDRGRFVGLVHATLDEDKRIAAVDGGLQPLTSRIPDNEAVTKLFQTYDMDVRRAEKASTTVPAVRPERRYAGAQKCEPCHAEIYAQWQGTKHAHAFDILTNQDRQYDRDCTPCHTAGFYETGGFLSIDHTPDLIHVQCESCHGNAGSHALSPTLKTPGDARTACYNCHTEHQSPDFVFDQWWERIRH